MLGSVTHRISHENLVNSGIDCINLCVMLCLEDINLCNDSGRIRTYQSGEKSRSSSNRSLPSPLSRHILPMISPEKAENAWSSRTTRPFISLSRDSRCRATSASIGCSDEIPFLEKKGSKGFLLFRWRSWPTVSKKESDQIQLKLRKS